MKLIGTLPSMSGVLERPEEIWPERGATSAQLVPLVRSRYEFQHGPTPEAAAVSHPNIFVSGKYPGEDSFAIHHLAMYQDGDVMVAQTTELADRALDDLISELDEQLGFRFATSNLERRRVSNLVVEFNEGIGSLFHGMGLISDLVNQRRDRGLLPFKRLSFGDSNMAPITDYMEACKRSDFSIEKRAGAPDDSKWYFSVAPMSTTMHIELLTEIERVALQSR